MGYSGITKVWELLLNNIKPLMKNEIVLLIRGNNLSNGLSEILSQNKYEVININKFDYMVMYQDVDYLDWICKNNKIDYFISTYYTYCTVIPNIQVIYDMIPEIFNFNKNNMWIQKGLAVNNASYFITISNTTTTDLLKYYPSISNSGTPIKMIYLSIPQTRNSAKYDDKFEKEFMANNNIKPGSYVLSVISNTDKYKNIQLIQKFSEEYAKQLSKKLNTKIPIIIITKMQLPNGYAFSNGILYLSHVSNEILNTLYKNAMCYISPSLYEGFGLTILEAFTHGIPVITNNIPVYKELASECIHFIDNNVDDLWDKVCSIHRGGEIVKKYVENGYTLLEKFTKEKQVKEYVEVFNNLDICDKPCEYINLVLQSYNEKDVARKKELEYCILENLNNPYVKYIHDFSNNSKVYLPENIYNHRKYLIANNNFNSDNLDTTPKLNIPDKWITYQMVFNYTNSDEIIAKYGNYWGLINSDIFLNEKSNWNNMIGRLNNGFVFAQSRHEFNILPTGEKVFKLDENFSQLFHSYTQDGWFFKAPLFIHQSPELPNADFELGFLGCDNAIAHRLSQSGYKVINQPLTFKIMHYDIVRGKTSENFKDKHQQDTENNKNKPTNTYPERKGSYLVPNYDLLMGNNLEMDFVNIIKQMGGISNWERYKMISELMSARIQIENP